MTPVDRIRLSPEEQVLCHALTGGYHCGKCGACAGWFGECRFCDPDGYERTLEQSLELGQE